MSWYVITFYFQGRRSGKRYEVPVTYHRASDGALEAVTDPSRRWWRNLRDDAEVSVLLKGKERWAKVEVVQEDLEAISKALDKRDLWRRLLVPVDPRKTVLLRVHLLFAPSDAD